MKEATKEATVAEPEVKPEPTIDTRHLRTLELKAHAFDILKEIERLQTILTQVNVELSRPSAPAPTQ